MTARVLLAVLLLLLAGCGQPTGGGCYTVLLGDGTVAHCHGRRAELDDGHLYIYFDLGSNRGAYVFSNVVSYDCHKECRYGPDR